MIFGLSLSSSWGNGHATTYRALTKALAARRHRVTFLERDAHAHRAHRDLDDPRWCRLALYTSLAEVTQRFGRTMRDADLVILGSRVPAGAALGEWITATASGVTAFYDLDTPETLDRLLNGGTDYLEAPLIPRFDLYLSATGGPLLRALERHFGSRRARPLYRAADTDAWRPRKAEVPEWDLGFLGAWSADRQPLLDEFLLEPARRLPHMRFVVAGARYPDDMDWPKNVRYIEHEPPARHPAFYGAQRFTLNLTRAAMKRAGYCPGARIMEAAACGAAIISDHWRGVETVLEPGREILFAGSTGDVIGLLTSFPETEREAVGAAARARAVRNHSGQRRAEELERYVRDLSERRDRAGFRAADVAS